MTREQLNANLEVEEFREGKDLDGVTEQNKAPKKLLENEEMSYVTENRAHAHELLLERGRFRRMPLNSGPAGESGDSLVNPDRLLLEGLETVMKIQESQKRKNREANNPWLFSCLKGLTVA